MHTSIPISPVELIHLSPTEISPLISKCQIKVCHVSDKPNRNGSVITKETALKMASSLRGAAIVGFFNEATGDFEEHNRIIDISNGKFEVKDTTRPYGFVDLGAPTWFEWFQDDGVPHEYLMTEGYLWTGQYPECARVIEKGNNQSMELDEETLQGNWATLDNSDQEFFIINEAIMSKLCILGEDVEPCFEGAQITKVQFSFDEGFQNQLFSMMNQMKQILKEEGGTPVFTRYNVQVGDSLWTSLYNFIDTDVYEINEICKEQDQVFAILHNNQDNKYYRLNVKMDDAGFSAEEQVELADYTPSAEPQFSLEDVEAYKKKKNEEKDPDEDSKNPEGKKDPKDKKSEEDPKDKKSENEDKKSEDEDKKSDKDSEDKKSEEDEDKKSDEKKSDDSEDEDEDEDDKKKKKKKKNFSLEDFVALHDKYAALEAEHNALKADYAKLVEFKNGIDREKKQEMINSFYMLSDDDKSDVIANIDKYSLDDIEAKLSVICVRNKVSFSLNEDEANQKKGKTFSINGLDEDDSVPAWVKAVQQTQKSMSM